ncbi:MAG: RNA polymerase sporulation sigma factor SigG [Clostridia bacterium]|nr:RNA polymerase sporulation sigma factor SigG [Clostridia bacterium]
MYYSKVEICGINTAELKTLSDDEKDALLHRAKDGDMRARNELIDGNLRLVLSVIQKFSGRGESADDLFQIGCVGLIKAIDNFDIGVGVKFSTYAVPMIIGEIRRYLRDNSMMRVSRGVRDLAYKALGAKEELSKKLSRDPTVEEIAQQLGEPAAEVSAALDAIVAPVSLYDPVYSDGGDSIYLLDQISDERSVDESWIDDIALSEAIKKLSERERAIVTMRFYRGKTQMEIADEIGISQAQVSRIEKSALDRIRKQL